MLFYTNHFILYATNTAMTQQGLQHAPSRTYIREATVMTVYWLKTSCRTLEHKKMKDRYVYSDKIRKNYSMCSDLQLIDHIVLDPFSSNYRTPWALLSVTIMFFSFIRVSII